MMEKQLIKELLDCIKNTDVEELTVEKPNLKIKIKKKPHIPEAPTPIPYQFQQPYRSQVPVSAQQLENTQQTSPENEIRGLVSIKSPIVGTFYSSPSPGIDPYVSVGDTVKKGQVLCIIEAMKLMNEIESDLDGKIVEMLVENNQPVEYGEILFLVEP